MSLRNTFIEWYYNQFRLDELYLNMDMTTEDSPWHRERTVGVHTDMVVAQYINAAPHLDWDKMVIIGAFACAFHDVGKPKAEVTKHSEERGEYRAYSGHEQLSARFWEDWACQNWTTLSFGFGFEIRDIYRVGWLIENHLPWSLKKKDKLDNFAKTWGRMEYGLTLPHVLMADTRGRIADDHADKIAASADWVLNMINYDGVDPMDCTPTSPDDDQPILFMPIGTSGCGKSTYFDTTGAGVEYFSWDKFRLDEYLDGEEHLMDPEDAYRIAFERSVEDKGFTQKANREFIELIKEGRDVYVDNTNLSKKRRNFFVTEARRRGYYTTAILFPIQFDALIARQISREDKFVPGDAVKRQYMSMQLPWYGEFDDVWVIDSNL